MEVGFVFATITIFWVEWCTKSGGPMIIGPSLLIKFCMFWPVTPWFFFEVALIVWGWEDDVALLFWLLN